MNDELAQFGGSLVRVATVPEEEFGEVRELVDREIGCQRSLLALLADNTNADVGCLNHRDIVAAVTDTANRLLCEGADEAGNVGFLCRRATASDDGRELSSEHDKFCAKTVEAKLELSCDPSS